LTAITLDYDSWCPSVIHADTAGPLEIASDYADPSTIKIKKPKKKKTKSSTRVSAILDDEGLLQDDAPGSSIDSTENSVTIPLSSTKRTYNENSELGDDEELQEILAQRRRQALKKRKISRPEDIARSVRESADEDGVHAAEDGGLVIDDTSEFVRGLEMSQLDRAASRPEVQTGGTSPEKMEIDERMLDNADIDMPDEVTGIAEAAEQSTIKIAPLEDEPIIAGSLAATLAALRRTGTFPESANLTFFL
jgi:U4/U6.U5 tri-snRNP-associated protein 1